VIIAPESAISVPRIEYNDRYVDIKQVLNIFRFDVCLEA